MNNIKTAVIQNSAGRNIRENMDSTYEMLKNLEVSPTLIALPELFALRGDDNCYREEAQTLDGSILQAVKSWCQKFDSFILIGSLLEQASEKIYNTSILLDPQGNIAATYRKIHLFEANLNDGTAIREADVYSPGKEPVMTELDGWKCGMSICYDLRFPELYRAYSSEGADIIFVPANFTRATGEAHWESLLRARAIENQCFVIAPNQCGTNPDTGVESYGNSMIIDPWGKIMARAGTEPAVITAELDASKITRVRSRIPALQHRRL